jgi:hypothetical protein
MILLDLHARSGTITMLAALQIVVDDLIEERQSGWQTLQDRQQGWTVRFTGGDQF